MNQKIGKKKEFESFTPRRLSSPIRSSAEEDTKIKREKSNNTKERKKERKKEIRHTQQDGAGLATASIGKLQVRARCFD